MNALILIIISVILGAFGQIALKMGADVFKGVSIAELLTKKLFSILTEKNVVVGVLLYGLASVLWIIALSKKELSYAYPLIGGGYILVALFSIFFLGEKITWMRWFGIILIVLGVIFVTRT